MKLHNVQIIESGHQSTARLFELGLSFIYCKKMAHWPSLTTINFLLKRGFDDGKLGTDIKWEPCELTQNEYLQAIDVVMGGDSYKIDDKDFEWDIWFSESYKGMTVNERLWFFNLSDEFENCIKRKDENCAVGVLIRAKFTSEQAKETARSVLENPKYYGY